jgi:NAD(P)-dependent dehydrogenase (short-subunit alcohol dehydrogenase family)
MRHKGKVVIVTGGGTGIGHACAHRFAAEGAQVVVAGRRLNKAEETVAEIRAQGGVATALQADVAAVADTQRLVEEAEKQYGALHVIINNAATVDLHRLVQDMTVEEWDYCVNATLRSVFLMAKWGAPLIRDSGGGSIINIGSVGAITPWAKGAPYCASKGGVLALTKVLAIEYGRWNIRVNALSPGSIVTPNLLSAMENRGTRELLEAKTVFHRLGQPEEIASVASFLASDEASFIATANIVADGGYLTM